MQTVTRDRTSYVFDRRLEPVARVQPGETITVETEDSCGGLVRTVEQTSSEALNRVLSRGYGNPVTGPIYVEGAEPGDAISVTIQHIEPDSQGYVGHELITSHFPEWFDDNRIVLCGIEDEQVHFGDLRIPIRPLLGTIGTAPAMEVLLSVTAGRHGGNMDCPDVAAGCVIHLPVYVDGALLFLGDVHAVQGDGELSGAGLETRSTVTLTISVRKPRPQSMTWPRLETPDSIMVIAADRPLESAVKLALRDMVLWLEEEYGWTKSDAYMLLSLVGSGRACQSCGWSIYPFTASVRVPRAYLQR